MTKLENPKPRQVVSEVNSINDEITSIKTNYSTMMSKIWSNSNWNTGWFQTKYTNASGSYAMLWNESDGGGNISYDKTANVISFIGTNIVEGDGDKSSAINVQIYSKDKSTNIGTRLNVNAQGMYYTKNKANGSFVSSEEVAVKNDLSTMLSDMYPIGSVYSTKNNSIPTNIASVGTWTLIATNIISKVNGVDTEIAMNIYERTA